MIKREDMLELTRRMTLERNCFSRIAGAYFDEEGYVDGTFNTQFLKLSVHDRKKNLSIAKMIPFAETNVNLKEYQFTKENEKPGSTWQMLKGLCRCELKNDAVLDVFYEVLGEKYQPGYPYAVYFFFGNYDVLLKGKDQEVQGESEEVYQFIVCAICPIHGDYEPGEPECGFLFPAFKERSADEHRINIFVAEEGNPHRELLELLLGA